MSEKADRWKALADQLLLSGAFPQKDYDLFIIDLENWRRENALQGLRPAS